MESRPSEFNRDPEANPQPATEPESETTVDDIKPTDGPDQVMPMAENAESTKDSIGSALSTALILSMLWLGPTLVVLARTRLRREAE